MSDVSAEIHTQENVISPFLLLSTVTVLQPHQQHISQWSSANGA